MFLGIKILTIRLFLFLVLLLTISLNPVQATDDCPFGITDDPAPGQCGLYTDSDKDGICDHSETTKSGEEECNHGLVEQSNTNINTKSNYKFVLITIILIIFYIISLLLERNKYISLFTLRRIWNVFLLFSFCIMATMGVMLVFAVNFGWFINWYSFLLYWHVEVGSVMIVITLFHLSWHWKYYTAIFQRSSKKKDENG